MAIFINALILNKIVLFPIKIKKMDVRILGFKPIS